MMKKWLKKYNILLKIGAAASSILLWFFVMSAINPDMTISFRDVPVTINGETELYGNEKEYKIFSDTSMTLDLDLRGKRNDLLGLKREDIKIVCDVSRIGVAGEWVIDCEVRLRPEITVLNEYDMKVTVEVDKLTTKEIAVVYETLGELGENMSIGEPIIRPDKMEISGPEGELNKIASAIVTVDLSALGESQSLSLPVRLVDTSKNEVVPKYAVPSVKAADVDLTVYYSKKVPLYAEAVEEGGLTAEDVEFLCTPAYITVTGEKGDVEQTQGVSLGKIPLREVGHGAAFERVIALPEGLESPDNGKTVAVDARVKDLEVRDFVVYDIALNGSHSRYNLSLVDKSVVIKLRGNSRVLDSIKPEDIAAGIDLASLRITSAGDMFAPVTVVVKPAVNVTVEAYDYLVKVNAVRK